MEERKGGEGGRERDGAGREEREGDRKGKEIEEEEHVQTRERPNLVSSVEIFARRDEKWCIS